jgi:hypothetical protein
MIMTFMPTPDSSGIDWNAVLAEMKTAEWYSDGECGEERRVYAGRAYHLNPSGKYYMPWACGNLKPCPGCKGTGQRKTTRKQRKIRKRHERIRRLADKRGLVGKPFMSSNLGRHNKWCGKHNYGYFSCEHCNGMGCHEAYMDEIWQELFEEEANSYGYGIQAGEGDPTDVYLCEYRDAECE